MAGSKISALTAITTVDDTDLFPIVDTSATTLKKMTRAQLRKLIADSPTDLAVLRYSSGSADWLVTTPSAMITGLTAITTLADADLLPINQSTTGKKVSVEQLRKQIFASPTTSAFVQYVGSDWVVRTPTQAGDSIRPVLFASPTTNAFVQYSGSDWVVKTPTQAASSIRPVLLSSPSDGTMLEYDETTSDYITSTPQTRRFRQYPTGRYTATIGATPSIITMSNTGGLFVGLPVAYAISSTLYFGIITAVSANTSITVAGSGLAAGAVLDSLRIGTESMVRVESFYISGAYGASVDAGLLGTIMKTAYKWRYPRAHLVSFSVRHNTAAATTQPTINVKIGGNSVSTDNSNNGIKPTTAGAWIDNTLASINSSNSGIDFDEAVEIACTVVGNPTGGALDLTVECVFVHTYSGT